MRNRWPDKRAYFALRFFSRPHHCTRAKMAPARPTGQTKGLPGHKGTEEEVGNRRMISEKFSAAAEGARRIRFLSLRCLGHVTRRLLGDEEGSEFLFCNVQKPSFIGGQLKPAGTSAPRLSAPFRGLKFFQLWNCSGC